ncbi:MAG: hypothetical protein JXA18_11895 [Chitinispirillaceae bacterium]|nr:hypothetical protein [Chitinispirillaceae bacterium]
MLKISPWMLLIPGAFVLLPPAGQGWPSDMPKPDNETVATKVDWIWENVIKRTVIGGGRGSYNTFFDQLHASASMGTFQVCIRWHSDTLVLSSTQRDKMESMLNRMMGQWTSKLKGYDGWPWDTIPVRISGWAGYEERFFQWSESDNGVPIYIGDDSFENAPQCPQSCGRFFHTDRNYTYPNCPGGAKNHYDFSSWHSDADKMDGMGFGSDWGQRTQAKSTITGMDGQMGIMLHEMGHGFFLPDFYDVDVPGGNPRCVMVAGAAFEVTEYDEWMLKRVYSELKRIPGRFPEVVVGTRQLTPVAASKRERVNFTVLTEQGQLIISPIKSTDQALIIDMYDISGRQTMSHYLHHGIRCTTAVGSLQGLNEGIFVVKITGKNCQEVHSINWMR